MDVIELNQPGAREKLNAIKQPVLTVFIPQPHLPRLLATLLSTIPQPLLPSPLPLLPITSDPYLLCFPNHPCLLILTSPEPRQLRLLTSLSPHILTYQLPQSTLAIIQKQYWSIRQLIHLQNIHDDIQLNCASSRVAENRVVSTVRYWRPKEVGRVWEGVTGNGAAKGLNLGEVWGLWTMYTRNPELKEEQIYQDKRSYIELKHIQKEQELFDSIYVRISQGDTLQMEETIHNLNLPDKKKVILLTLFKKVEMLQQIQITRKRGQSQDKRYQNIKHLSLDIMQVQHVQAANKATVDHWIKHMLGNLESAYNDISSHKDTRTLNNFTQLYVHYSLILKQLMSHTSKNCQTYNKLQKMKNKLDWFYQYHDSFLKGEIGSTLKFIFNQILYLMRKKSVVIQKILIIFLVLLMIELFSMTTFLTMTLTLVAGIFYLKN